MLIRKTVMRESDNEIIASFMEETQNQNVDTILNQLLIGMVPCPSVTTDDLDVARFPARARGWSGSFNYLWKWYSYYQIKNARGL